MLSSINARIIALGVAIATCNDILSLSGVLSVEVDTWPYGWSVRMTI